MQQDYAVFEQLANTSDALSFVSDAAYSRSANADGRKVIPIAEGWVQASFHLLCPVGDPQVAQDPFDWAAGV